MNCCACQEPATKALCPACRRSWNTFLQQQGVGMVSNPPLDPYEIMRWTARRSIAASLRRRWVEVRARMRANAHDRGRRR
jgi:hypothetical protein